MEEDLMTSVSEDSSVSVSQDGAVNAGLIQDGTTSVALDVDTLSSAAGLTLVPELIDGAVESIPADFGVGFDITEESTFVVDQNTGTPIPVGADPSDGTPLFGEIEHTGTVTFTSGADTSEAADITVGDFTIGFDPNRVPDDALDMDTPQPSGFFVANGVEGALDGAILFDVSISDLASVQITDTGLSVGSADLLVSEEFATVLGDASLIGADVGDTTVQAIFGSPVV